MKINDKHEPESDRSRGSPSVLPEMEQASTLSCASRRDGSGAWRRNLVIMGRPGEVYLD